MNVTCWFALTSVLLVFTFGLEMCFFFLFYIIFAVIGIAFIMYFRVKTSHQLYCVEKFPVVQYPKARFKMHSTEPKLHKFDQRLTGSSIIDDPLQEVIHYAFRDCIQNWYCHISADDEFILSLKEVVKNVIVTFSSRCKEIDWVPYLTTRIVDEFASHLRLFRQAQAKMKNLQKRDSDVSTDLLSVFFDLETAMEDNLSRDCVCTSEECELDYLKELCDVVLYLLLPPREFENMISRTIIQEIVVNAAVLPLIQLVTDPDYINQVVVWLGKDAMLTTDGFLLVLRCADNVGELQAVQEMIHHEIAVQRSKDTGGDDDAEIKQQLRSLSYVRRVMETRISRLNEGGVDTDSTGIPTGIDWKLLTEPGVKLFSLHFDVVLTNNIALHYFTDFMTSISAQGYVFFYHSVESYKISAEQLLSQAEIIHVTKSSATPPDLEHLREAAIHIFDLYLSDKAVLRVKMDETLLKKLLCRIRTERPNSTWFDEAQSKAYEVMLEEPYFPAFKKSQNYIKLLAELDLLKEVNLKTEDEGMYNAVKASGRYSADELSLCDSISLSSLDQDEYGLEYLNTESGLLPEPAFPSSHGDELEKKEHAELAAQIYNTGIANESGNMYAVYAISVTQRDLHGSEDKWVVLRRYSDFRDFHFILLQKYPQLSFLQFPAKKTFNNLSPQFLEKRTSQLSEYLQCLMNPETLNSIPGLKVILLQFLEPKVYEKGRKPLAKTVSAIVNPLRSSVKSVGHLVRNMPDSVMDGLKDGLVRVLGNRSTSPVPTNLPESSKVAAGLDIEGEDNIPLRIMLLLMDEVFDLKSKDQWFRKRIVILLQQIINATYGDTINRKILDFVQKTTSAEQVAEYIRTFKQAMWPNGSLAAPTPERDQCTKMRTRIAAKLVLLCSIPDELKHVIGSETIRKGVLCVFEMFQHPELNRRLFYVLFEGILETLFPVNNLRVIFRRLHSRSPRTVSKKSKWPVRHTVTESIVLKKR